MNPDREWMLAAIREGEKGRVNAPPNPWVGCLIVKNGRIVGKGHHPECGKPHAEPFALREAGSLAEGATVYVTLEPCAHYGRTPPCVQALIDAKVAKVVVGLEDPDPKVRGKGLTALRQAGILVETGVCKDEAEQSLWPYLVQRRSGKPFVLLKTAVSIDGRIAAQDGTSQWISSVEARTDSHQLRAESQAIMVGAGTAIKDQPRLTVRTAPEIPKKPPLRVLLDRSGIVPNDSPLFDTKEAPTLVFSNRLRKDVSVEIIQTTDIHEILTILAQRGVLQVLVEGGSGLITELLSAHAVDQLIVYTGSMLLGNEGIPFVKELGIGSMKDAPNLKLLSTCQLGDTIKSCYAFIF
jgi:diaminohydroxyphosphoribosylaminopyrimidine deaminase / 5-amino-6-(5-phosphoribosylamino)uracil reductase